MNPGRIAVAYPADAVPTILQFIQSTPTPLPDAARIPGYDLAPPGEADIVASLARVFGAERGAALWLAACRAAGTYPGFSRSEATLERAIEALRNEGGAAASVARSVEIRMRTYRRLSTRATSTEARA